MIKEPQVTISMSRYEDLIEKEEELMKLKFEISKSNKEELPNNLEEKAELEKPKRPETELIKHP